MPRRALIVAITTLALGVASCGGDGGSGDPLTVSAASSLTTAFERYGQTLSVAPRLSFAGSDQLAAQIEQGARPDVFASASPAYPERLASEGLLEDPIAFASNRLVIAVPAGTGGDLSRVGDLARPGLDLVIGAHGVPAGDYARQALARLPEPEREAILANVRSEEPEVTGIVGKLAQGAADAGFVYASDVAAADGAIRAIRLPARLEPDVTYEAGVVTDSDQPRAAARFVRGLVRGPGAAALRRAGFLPPPSR